MTVSAVIVRPEDPADVAGIRRVHQAAFPNDAESRLVDALRHSSNLSLSLVGELAGQVVAHLACSPVAVADELLHPPAWGLAPIAVLPEYQRQGIGSQLTCAGIDACRDRVCGFLVVLGEPAFYRRFGFVPASRYHLDNCYGADEAFMALELISGSIPAAGGMVAYGPEFSMFDS